MLRTGQFEAIYNSSDLCFMLLRILFLFYSLNEIYNSNLTVKIMKQIE
jgi:hypothetical protein